MPKSPLGYRNYSEPMKYMIHNERTAIVFPEDKEPTIKDKWDDLFWRIEHEDAYGQDSCASAKTRVG